jgi:hypothetical protein
MVAQCCAQSKTLATPMWQGQARDNLVCRRSPEPIVERREGWDRPEWTLNPQHLDTCRTPEPGMVMRTKEWDHLEWNLASGCPVANQLQ